MSTTPASHTVMVVTADADLARAYAQLCGAVGLKSQHIDDSAAALPAAMDAQPSAIVLDGAMPGMSGFDAVDIIRHSPETSATVIMLLVPLSTPSERARAKAMGVRHVAVNTRGAAAGVVHKLHAHLHPTATANK